MLHKGETRILHQILHIVERPGIVVVQADDAMPLCNESVTKVRTYESCSAGDKYVFHRVKSIVEKSVKEARWEALENLDEYNKIVLNENSVLDNLDVTLVRLDGTKINLKELRKVKVKKKEG